MQNEFTRIKLCLTVIIPVYNRQDTIARCIRSLFKGKSPSISLEILLIDDGSTDGSADVCKREALKQEGIRYFYQENRGVSAARNLGLKYASGKYIFFLDADDMLAPGTLEHVARFFDTVCGDVDLVTYPIETIYRGKKLEPHFRYRYLKESGVYDLREYPYIGQTTMNIAVKNRFSDNLLFDERQTFSEDQKYCCIILREKGKMGFCSGGKYIYYRDKNSASGRLAGSCYIFEQCTSFFEQLFSCYGDGEVPLTFQGLFVNDMYWKLVSNILFPYHYGEEAFFEAKDRLSRLLGQCENHVILKHPEMDFFEKYYLLRQKGKDTLRAGADEAGFYLTDGKQIVLREKSMEAVLTKVSVNGCRMRMEGFLKTVFFLFYEEAPTFCAVENGGSLTRKLKLHPSAHNYYLSHEPTQHFFAFSYECDAKEVTDAGFLVEVFGRWFPVHYYFMPLTPFSHRFRRYVYEKDRLRIEIDESNRIHLKERADEGRCRIWLYYDCKGTAGDNGMLQFLHDREKRDGIRRYYVWSDRRQKERLPEKREGAAFGGRRHRELFLKAEKIITAYIEADNLIPYPADEYDRISGKLRFEVIYLQHGVLHIEMPWKYSPEKILADQVVVSTGGEAALFEKNGFRAAALWKYRMPRFDRMPRSHRIPEKRQEPKPRRKILFAPSWRSYLAGENSGRTWELLSDKFLQSVYFRKIRAFLCDENLHEILRRNDYTLEVKLHPVFAGYAEYFSFLSGPVSMVEEADAPEDYALFLTDFSSYQYDFLFHGIPVLIFVPDLVEFKAGMNGYRRFYSGGTAYGPAEKAAERPRAAKEWDAAAAEEPGEIVEEIRRFIEEGVCPVRKEEFFEGDGSMDRIYEAMLGGIVHSLR